MNAVAQNFGLKKSGCTMCNRFGIKPRLCRFAGIPNLTVQGGHS
jgi:hypothetical protein